MDEDLEQELNQDWFSEEPVHNELKSASPILDGGSSVEFIASNEGCSMQFMAQSHVPSMGQQPAQQLQASQTVVQQRQVFYQPAGHQPSNGPQASVQMQPSHIQPPLQHTVQRRMNAHSMPRSQPQIQQPVDASFATYPTQQPQQSTTQQPFQLQPQSSQVSQADWEMQSPQHSRTQSRIRMQPNQFQQTQYYEQERAPQLIQQQQVYQNQTMRMNQPVPQHQMQQPRMMVVSQDRDGRYVHGQTQYVAGPPVSQYVNTVVSDSQTYISSSQGNYVQTYQQSPMQGQIRVDQQGNELIVQQETVMDQQMQHRIVQNVQLGGPEIEMEVSASPKKNNRNSRPSTAQRARKPTKAQQQQEQMMVQPPPQLAPQGKPQAKSRRFVQPTPTNVPTIEEIEGRLLSCGQSLRFESADQSNQFASLLFQLQSISGNKNSGMDLSAQLVNLSVQLDQLIASAEKSETTSSYSDQIANVESKSKPTPARSRKKQPPKSRTEQSPGMTLQHGGTMARTGALMHQPQAIMQPNAVPSSSNTPTIIVDINGHYYSAAPNCAPQFDPNDQNNFGGRVAIQSQQHLQGAIIQEPLTSVAQPKKAARKRPSKKGANSENLNPVAISTASNAAPGQILICTGGNASQPMVIQYATPGENIYTTGPSGSQQIVLQYQPVPLSTADGNELIVEAPPRLPTPLILPSPQELAQRIEAKRETRRNKLAVFFRLLRERLDKTDFITPYESRADAINRLLPFALHDEPDFSPEYMEKVDYELYRHSVYMEDKVRNIEGRLRKIFYDDAMGKREHDYELNMLYYLDAEYEQRRLKTDQVDAKNDNDSFLRESEIIRSGVDYADLKERETKIPTRPDNFNDISQSQFEYHDFDERIYEREIPRTPSPPRSKPRRGKKKREKQRYLYASDLDDSEEDEDDEMDDEKTEESSDENESDFETAEREKREAQLAQLNAATLKISSIEVMCSVEKDSNNVDDLIVEIKRETELISSLLKDGELTPRTSANASSTLILANDLIARLRRLQTEAMEKRANQQLQSTIVKEIPIGDVKSKRHHDEKIKSSLPQDLENVMPSVFLNPMIPNTDIGNVPPIAALNQWASQHVQPLVDTVESRTKTSPIENVTLPRPFTPEDDRPSAQNFARLSRKNSPPLLINLVQELSRERPEPTASTRVMVAPPELLFGKASQSSTIPADDMPRLQPISPTTTNVSQRLAGMPPNVLNAAIGQAKSELLNARIAEVQKSQQTIPPPKLSPDAWKGLQLKSSATTMVQARNEMHKPPHLQPSTMPEKSTSRLLEPPAAFDDPRLLNISANQTETHLLPPTNVDRPPSTSRPFTLKQRLLNKTPINIHQSAQMPPPTQSNMLRHDTHHSTGGSSPKKRRTSGVSSPSKSQINLSSSQSSLSTESKPSLKLTFRKSDNGVNSISASQKSTATHSTASQKTGGLTLKLPLKASKVSDPLALKFEPTPSSSSTKTAEEKAERKRLKKEKKREKEKAREKEKKHEKEKKREKEPREKEKSEKRKRRHEADRTIKTEPLATSTSAVPPVVPRLRIRIGGESTNPRPTDVVTQQNLAPIDPTPTPSTLTIAPLRLKKQENGALIVIKTSLPL